MEQIPAILIIISIYAMFAMSLNLDMGHTGLPHLGPVACFGIGAYASALLNIAGLPVSLSIFTAMGVSALAGTLLALTALSMKGEFFSIITFAFAETVHLFFRNEIWLTGGRKGLNGIGRPVWIEEGPLGLPLYLATTILLAALVFLVMRRIISSPFGRTLHMIRENEQIARLLGKHTTGFKVQSIVVSSLVAGLAGALWAHYAGHIEPDDFTVKETILVILCIVTGGTGTARGPVLGTFLIVILGETLYHILAIFEMTRFVNPIRGMIFGILLLFFIFRRPGGILKTGTVQ